MAARKSRIDSGARPDQRRKRRKRPTPKWLLEQKDLDDMARRRCLMILSALSGEKPISDLIAESKISRGTYYELESRALTAMVRALTPGSPSDGTSEGVGWKKRIEELEKKVVRLEREKRRAERLLQATRTLVRPGKMVMSVGRKRGRLVRQRSTMPGKKPLKSSTGPKTSSTVVATSSVTSKSSLTPKSSPSSASTLTSAGAVGRSDGTES